MNLVGLVSTTCLLIAIGLVVFTTQRFKPEATEFASFQHYTQLSSALLAISLLLSVGLTWWVKGRVLQHSRDLRDLVNRLVQGDLTKPMQPKFDDEIGQTIKRLNVAVKQFSDALTHADDLAGQSQAVSGGLQARAASLKDSSLDQKAGVTELLGVIDKLTSDFAQITSSVKQAESIGRNSEVHCAEMTREAEETKQLIEKLDGNFSRATVSIEGLGDRSREIQGITQIIEGIASQTNLLALNAAIEAARAGESGRGFAVVADQVRRLADQTAEATEQIARLVHDVMSDTESAMSVMDGGANNAKALQESFAKLCQQIKVIKHEAAVVRELSSKTLNSVEMQVERATEAQFQMNDLARFTTLSADLSQDCQFDAAEIERLTGQVGALVKRFTL